MGARICQTSSRMRSNSARQMLGAPMTEALLTVSVVLFRFRCVNDSFDTHNTKVSD